MFFFFFCDCISDKNELRQRIYTLYKFHVIFYIIELNYHTLLFFFIVGIFDYTVIISIDVRVPYLRFQETKKFLNRLKRNAIFRI